MRSFFLTELLWSQRLKAKLISQKRIKRKCHFASSRHISSRTHYEDVISLLSFLFGRSPCFLSVRFSSDPSGLLINRFQPAQIPI